MMTGKWIAMSAAVLLTGSMLVAADEPADKPATPPTSQPAEARHETLPKFWNELGLSEGQIAQAEKIRAEASAKRTEINTEEKKELSGVLTDDQKAQLKALEDKAKAEKKHHKKPDATTEPAAPAAQ